MESGPVRDTKCYTVALNSAVDPQSDSLFPGSIGAKLTSMEVI